MRHSAFYPAPLYLVLALAACTPRASAPEAPAQKAAAPLASEPASTALATPVDIPKVDPIDLSLDNPFVLNGVKAEQLASIKSVHKITREISFFYTDIGQTWIYDRGLEVRISGGLNLIESPVSTPTGQRLYPLQADMFWIVGADSIAGSRLSPDPNQQTMPAAQIKNSFQKAGKKDFRTIFVDNFRVMTTDSSKLSIIERNREGTIYKELELDIPSKDGAQTVYAGGLGADPDQYWLARASDILYLQLKDGKWTWSQGSFSLKVKGAPLAGEPQSLAMMIRFDGSKRSVVGGAIAQTADGFFSNDLVAPLYVEQKLRLQIDNVVEPEFKAKCLPCHRDYATLAAIKPKAKAMIDQLEKFTMPPSTASPLANQERGLMIRWLREGFGQ